MKFLCPQSALSFGAAFLFFLPSILQVSATNTCKTITQIACSKDSLDIFCKALEKTGLDDKLNDLNIHFTAFAPTNAAFEEILNDLKYNNIYECPKDTLRQLLLYHIREYQVLDREGLADRCTELLEMANGESTRTICQDHKNRIFQKGSGNSNAGKPEIISFDNMGSNGIVHILNEVMLPSDLAGRSPTSDPTRMFYFNEPTPRPTKRPNRSPTSSPTKMFDYSSSCSLYPKCVEEGLTGECCPTDNGMKLDCCFDNEPKSSSCSAHPQCVELGLKGECCPTDDGKKLECCSGKKPTLRPTRKPTPKPSIGSSCSAHPQCVDLGLTGECCPTDDGEKLKCCFEDHGTCSTNPKCEALGLTGECCPTDDRWKLDCCFDKPPAGSCAAYPRCRELGLKGECCPTDGSMQLDCCKEEAGLPITGESYCQHSPDFRCYKFGVPHCCLAKSIACPKIKPECEIGWPDVGESYCAYAPDFGCYKNGRPECCLDDSIECPENRPECEVGFPIVGDSYCTFAPHYGCYKDGWPECCLETTTLGCPMKRPKCDIGFIPNPDGSYCSDFPDYKCYERGHPSCCFTKDPSDCPAVPPPCNVGARGCEMEDSLPSLYDFVCSQHNFDILCYLIEKTGLDEVLDKDGTLTLFVPSNQAFKNLGEGLIEDLLENDIEKLKDILLHHASDSINFSDDLLCNQKLTTLIGIDNHDCTTTKCDNDGQKFQVGKGNNLKWPWIQAKDVVTCNGVAHVVNNVILP
mmetsp:Transcript_24536/g.57999  ORF Transcript_24536/g.57999 Transcript_24536/m.57999 type:complete len:747 (+) Transcript_24536:118-2358(+)